MKKIFILMMTFLINTAHADKLCTIDVPAWLATVRNKTQPTDPQYTNTTTALLYGGMWQVESDGHLISGQGFCSDTSGTHAQTGNPKLYGTSESVTVNCWCRMTTPALGLWVFRATYASHANCAGYCATDCAGRVSHEANFRAAVLVPLRD
jgi:hypothetical protein